MLEGSIMQLAKYIIWILGFLVILSATIFFIEMGGVNTFEQYVNYQIERKGGLTEEAILNINEHSKKSYKGRFTVESDKLNKKVQYGEVVNYKIKGVFEIKFFPVIPDVVQYFEGTGVSQIR